MKTQHTTIGTAAKRFASVVCGAAGVRALPVLATLILFAPSAQAYDPPPDITPYISTDNEFETEYNPFALPNTMAHWMSALVRHECWTSYQGGNRGFQSFWNCAGNWFMWTNHYYTVNMPSNQREYYWNYVTQNYFPDNNFLGKDNTCLAYIQKAAEAKVGTSGKLTDDAEIGENITVALCQLLRPHEYGDPNDKAPHLWCCSNHLQYVDTEYRVVRTSNFASGLRIDATSWSRSNKIARFDYCKYPKTAATEPNVAPTELVNIFYGHYSPGISNCIATLNRVSDDWTGTYLLHNRDYGRTEVKETVRYLAYNEETPKEPIETMTNRTRTVTHPDAWPALDEDVYLDRGDVLIMKSLCYMVDSAAQLLRAYELPGTKSGIWADPACTNIVKVQENMHAIGYTYRTAWITNHLYRVGYSDRIERAINDTYHMLPDFFASIDDDVALAGAREAYLNALACFLDADAFITGKAKSKTGKTITGQRDPEQLHLIEFDEESQDEKGIAGWREFAEKTYASLTGKGTAAAVQTLDMVDLGKTLDIHVGSRGDADHGVIDFSSLGPNRDGKITFDANAFFDGKITRNAVILDGSAITTNGPGYMVATRFSTERSGGGDPGDSPYAYVNRLHLTLSSSTVSPTLNGLYPSGTLIDDLVTMKQQFPADGAELRSGFAKMTDVTTCERQVITEDTTIADGVYTAPATNVNGGAFYVNKEWTLYGTNVTFSGNSAAQGGAIYIDEWAGVGMYGTFTLATAGDTIYNNGGKVMWYLTDGNAGLLSGYENLTNNNGHLYIWIDDAIVAPTNIVIATGNLSDVSGKDTFTVFVALDTDATFKIDGPTVASTKTEGVGYRLVREEDPANATTNLVFKCIKYTAVRTVLESGESTNLVAGVYTAAPATEDGGAFYVGDDATLTGENVTFADNSAKSGGAIYNNSGTVTIKDDASFIANAATDNKGQTGGGAIYNTSDGTVSVEGDATFSNNTTANGGGAIFNRSGTVSVEGDATFNDNTAVTGGAIFNLSHTVIAGNATFTGNTATSGGGAIKNNAGTVEFSGTDSTVEFSGNTVVGEGASFCGGAIYNSASGDDGVSFAGDAVFSNNTASCGGAIYGYGTISFAGDATFCNNTAGSNGGGAIYKLSGTLSVAGNATFTGNTATGSGGAIYNDKSRGLTSSVGVMNLGDAVFSNNTAASNGGAIYNGTGGAITLNSATFNGNKVTDEGAKGGAIYNLGTVNMAGAVTLATATDTVYNAGTLNWNLADGKAGCLNGYDKLENDGTLQITVDDAIAAPKSIVIATGNFSDIAGKDTFVITNVSTGTSVELKVGDITKVGADWWTLAVEGESLVFKSPATAKLSDVVIIDEEGKTNATAVVYAGDIAIEPSEDGSHTVPQGYPLKLVYTAQGDYMFGPGLKQKTAWLDALTGDTSLDDPQYADIKPAAEPRWVDSDGEAGGREIALDTRERIVVAAPEDVLPIAYSTNYWGESVITGDYVMVASVRDGNQDVLVTAYENGYAEWMPQLEQYGVYKMFMMWVRNSPFNTVSTNATIYYSTYFPLSWAAPEHGTLAVTLDGQALSSPTNVLGYSLLNLAATVEPHYEFKGWSAVTNGVTFTDAFTNAATLVTRFEMPNADTEIKADIAWQSAFTEKKTVDAGETWEVFADDDYQGGLTNNGTVVWKPGTTNEQGKASGLGKFSQLHNGTDGKMQIAFDETLTNGTYKIAGDATEAVGQTFEITNGTGAKEITVVAQTMLETTPWTYVGAKRFKLYVDASGNLQLTVQPGIPMALVYEQPKEGGTFTVVTGDYQIVSGTKIYPGDTVTLAFTPTNGNWQVNLNGGESENGIRLIDATNKVYDVSYFTPTPYTAATFPMTETNATLVVKFMISDDYRSQLEGSFSTKASEAKKAIDDTMSPWATPAQKTEYKKSIDERDEAAKKMLADDPDLTPGQAESLVEGTQAFYDVRVAEIASVPTDCGGATNVVESGAWARVVKAGESVWLTNGVITATNEAAGAILVDGGTVILENFTITGVDTLRKSVAYPGAPVRVARGALYIKAGTSVKGNTAKKGGAVYVTGGTFVMTGGEILGNSSVWGGGVLVEGGSATISGGTISGNTALLGGGVAVVGDGSATVSGGAVTGNRANGYGGGVFSQGAARVFITAPESVTGNSCGLDPKANDVYTENAE